MRSILHLERRFDVLAYVKRRGLSYKESSPNIYLTCPSCDKPKLWVLIKDKPTRSGIVRAGAWICYKCAEFGRSPITLIQRLESCDRIRALQILSEGPDAKRSTSLRKAMEEVLGSMSEDDEFIASSDSSAKSNPLYEGFHAIDLPSEYTSDFSDPRAVRGAKAYGLTPKQIARYKIGWCPRGYFGNRLIVPVVAPGKGPVISFVARWMSRKVPPGAKKVIYPKKKTDESVLSRCLFNYDTASRQRVIVIVEDVFSSSRVGKCGVATFGTNLSRFQKELLLHSAAEEIVLMWDRDATVRHKPNPCGLIRDPKTGKRKPCPHCARYEKTQKLLLWLSEFWKVKLVILPDGRDPKDHSRAECWRMIRKTQAHDARSALRASIEARI